MASWTDNLGYLTSHRDYVQQLPVDAMVYVGEKKQQQYNEGIQKIQSQIDTVAGMDIAKPIHKEYLQSKLNQLGNNLKKVAAGDFSNYQLVNSVGGMIGQISKDPVVQNAYSSTVRYRKGLNDLENAKKEGKSSPSNEWDFNNQVNSWMNDPNLKSSFSGGYNPYTNYKKNALDLIKGLTKDETITDDAFTTDRNGNLVISDALVRKKLAGIAPEKIQQALVAGLTPQDFKQMEIDGRYNYSNISPQQFSQKIQESYRSKLDAYVSQKNLLENAKSSTTSVLQKNKLDEQIASLDKTIRGISAEHQSMNSMISQGNIEGAKAQLHTSDFINNFSKAFSFTETSNTYQTNPFVQPAQWRFEQDREWNKFMLNYAQKEREIGIQEAKLKLDKKAVEGYGALPGAVNQSNLPNISVAKVLDKTLIDEQSLNNFDNSFLVKNNKDPKWLSQQREAFNRSPSAVDPSVAYHLKLTEPLRRNVEANKSMLLDSRKKVSENLGIPVDVDRLIDSLIPKSAQNVHYTDGRNNFTYTPRDFVDFNNKFPKFISQAGTLIAPSSGMGGGKNTTIYDYEKAKRQMTPKEYRLFELMSSQKSPDNEADQALLDNVRHYSEIVNQPHGELLGRVNQGVEEELKNRITSPQPTSVEIPTYSKEQRGAMDNLLSRFANLSEDQKGELANSPDFSQDTARKLAASDNTSYSIDVGEGSEFQPTLYKVHASGTVGGKLLTTSFNVTPEQKSAVFGDRFEAPTDIRAIRPYQEQIMKMGGFSTALSPEPSNHENAYLSSIDFPSVSSYGVKANIEQPYAGKYIIKLSIFDPSKKVWMDNLSYPSEMINANAIHTALSGLSDAAIYQMINEKPATAGDLKKIKEDSKKPF